MGLGKPFGLGAIEARATSMTAHKGEDLAERYESLDGCLGHMPTGPESPSPGIADFSSVLGRFKLDEQPWVEAMQRAAYGYDDVRQGEQGKAREVEVRYMTLEENRANNQTVTPPRKKGERKAVQPPAGSPAKGRGLSPIDLFGSMAEQPLTVQPRKQKKKRKSSGGKSRKKGKNDGKRARSKK